MKKKLVLMLVMGAMLALSTTALAKGVVITEPITESERLQSDLADLEAARTGGPRADIYRY